jgi:hypothetical protein
MTAMTGSADCPPARLAATRDGLHRVAEHLLAAARYAASGEIGLVPAPGGFRTPPFGPDGRFLAVDGTELVVGDAAATRRTALTTLRAAAEFAGVTPGAPAQVYRPATPLDPDEPLMIDPLAARLLAEWYQLGAQALSQLAAEVRGDRPSAAVLLSQLAAEVRGDRPSAAVLWPEHFDVGITAGAINYGAFRQIGTVAEAAAFFRDGRARALAAAAATPIRRTS